jgi:hypothetical protein
MGTGQKDMPHREIERGPSFAVPSLEWFPEICIICGSDGQATNESFARVWQATHARGVRFGRPPKLTGDWPRASVPAMPLRASGEGSGTAGLSTAPDSPDFR